MGWLGDGLLRRLPADADENGSTRMAWKAMLLMG